MKNPPKVSEGDRVRIVIEGVVGYASTEFLDIGESSIHAVGGDHVVSVEVLTPPVKVGDEVTGDVAYGLPVGSVVLYEPGGGASVKVADGAWARDPDEGYEPIYMPIWGTTTPLRVLHLGRAA